LEQAFNRGDAAAVAALHTEDAALLPPGADILRGRRAAQEIGRFSLEVPGQGGQATKLEGKYGVVWKGTADGWRLATGIGT
jgi:ketosteroid isomerase-like protein